MKAKLAVIGAIFLGTVMLVALFATPAIAGAQKPEWKPGQRWSGSGEWNLDDLMAGSDYSSVAPGGGVGLGAGGGNVQYTGSASLRWDWAATVVSDSAVVNGVQCYEFYITANATLTFTMHYDYSFQMSGEGYSISISMKYDISATAEAHLTASMWLTKADIAVAKFTMNFNIPKANVSSSFDMETSGGYGYGGGPTSSHMKMYLDATNIQYNLQAIWNPAWKLIDWPIEVGKSWWTNECNVNVTVSASGSFRSSYKYDGESNMTDWADLRNNPEMNRNVVHNIPRIPLKCTGTTKIDGETFYLIEIDWEELIRATKPSNVGAAVYASSTPGMLDVLGAALCLPNVGAGYSPIPSASKIDAYYSQDKEFVTGMATKDKNGNTMLDTKKTDSASKNRQQQKGEGINIILVVAIVCAVIVIVIVILAVIIVRKKKKALPPTPPEPVFPGQQQQPSPIPPTQPPIPPTTQYPPQQPPTY